MPPGDKVNFNLYNLSGDMLAFLREDTLTELQQDNILGVLGLTTEGLEGPQGEQGFPGFKYDIRRTTANNNNGYVVGEIVEYEGSYYICLSNNDAIIPTNTTYWTPYSFVGPEGPQGQSSTELLKPYLYNKHLAETVVPAYWQYDGWDYVYGPGSSGYEITIFPDGVTQLSINGGFVNPLTQDSYGYDPLPFSLNLIITDSGNPADKVTIDAILQTIGNCTTILEYPAGFTRLLDLASANFDNGGAFFSEPIQTIIETMLATGWTIDWPFDGIGVNPYNPIEDWPSYNSLAPGIFYSQFNGVLYSSTSSPTVGATPTLGGMSSVPDIGVFPYRDFRDNYYFTSYDLQMPDPTVIERQYYFYNPA
jgi:hypothetical protein